MSTPESYADFLRSMAPLRNDIHQVFDALCHKIWLLEQRIEAVGHRNWRAIDASLESLQGQINANAEMLKDGCRKQCHWLARVDFLSGRDE